eukprot:XP_019073612.1 PREDICTED: uncharacterized protein LOC104878130 [Vitis vinifera]
MKQITNHDNFIISFCLKEVIIRRVNKVDRSDLKENVETSEQGKGKSSFLVKTKADTKMVPQVSNTTTNLIKNRASDGFISMFGLNIFVQNPRGFWRRLHSWGAWRLQIPLRHLLQGRRKKHYS